MLSGLGYDLSLQLMILGVQYVVLDALPAQHAGKFLGSLNGDRTYQHRLSLGMCLFDSLHDSLLLFLLGLINRILQILTGNGLVGGDLDNVHAVDISEFLLFRQCGTGHAGLLIEFVKEVLEGNGS